MVLTRSRHGKEGNTDGMARDSSDSGSTPATGETGTTTTHTWTHGSDATVTQASSNGADAVDALAHGAPPARPAPPASNGATHAPHANGAPPAPPANGAPPAPPALVTPAPPGAGAIADTSGIQATPAASSVNTMVGRHSSKIMPPPSARPPPAPARSRRSKASSIRLRAELEAKEKLAALELQRIQAEAALEKIRLEKIAAESSSSDTEGEDENLASHRVEDWFQRGAGQEETAIEERRGCRERSEVPAHAVNAQQEKVTERPRPQPQQSMDVTSLSAALVEAIQSSKSTKKYITELPSFSGQCGEWLQFKAAYVESSSSFSPSENVMRIRKSLKGVAMEAVSSLLISQPRPEDLIAALERRYGRPDALLLNEMEKLKSLPRLTDGARDLCAFAGRISNTVATIEILKKPQYLYNPEVLRLIVDKLTPIQRNKWYDYATTREEVPELKRICEFLNIEADKCAPYAPPEASDNKEAKTSKKRIERTYTATNEPSRKSSRDKITSCPMCKQSHQLPACPQFLKIDTNERWEVAKKNHVCYRCLSSTHRRLACRSKPCGSNGCPMRHHHLLHHEKNPSTDKPTDEPPAPKKEEVVASTIQAVASAAASKCRGYLKIAPVTLRGPNAAVETFALLDEGSTVTIIDSSLADTLGLDGPTETMWVQGVNGKEMEHKRSKRVNVSIRGRHSNDEQQIFNARTVESLAFTTQSVGEKEIEDCPHLEEIKEELVYSNATPKILIGQDNWELIVSREIRRGRRDQLVASRTAIGWVLHGCRASRAEPIAFCCAHLTESEPNDRMEKMMKEYFELESLSIEPRRQRSDPELQALKILEERSRRLPSGRFETGLLWREEDSAIPNNRADALKRLYTLERKLDRDEKLKKEYTERIENLKKSNYAERAVTPPRGRLWYLPHFAVTHPEKKKIRVVHDAAAKSHGLSLNDMLLPGPDLLQSLPGVVMRFRQYNYGVSSDISEMFMQVKIREEDRDALRFLWRGDRREGPPDEYRMTSVVFGASSSPCTALYIKNRNAREHASEYPEAAQAIERNHYMDDYLHSFATLEEAERITSEVDYIHKQAGFVLRGWAANDNEAIKHINERKQDGTTVPIGGSEMEKTLGLLWDTSEDSIRFRVNTRRAPAEVIQDLRPPTKREALSIIMSIFDPLGLISPFTTPAKRIMQDTWRYNTGWDDEIPDELHGRWSEWLQQLRDLGDLSIPRCYDKERADRYELHTFVDASEEAYAAAVYWRITRPDGGVKVALAAAKSRVTPTKPISVPRLELQAAVLGVRLAKTVADEHDFKIARKVFWSDSRTALFWVRSEPRTYKTFVAHRLAEIEDLSKKNEWRWLPSADNVADDTTRATPVDFGPCHRWFNGPRFLYENEDSWPAENKVEVPATRHCAR